MTQRSDTTRRGLKRDHRYHRIAGYVPLGYGLTCMAVNLEASAPEAPFGFVAGVAVALVGLAHLWSADRVARTRLAAAPGP